MVMAKFKQAIAPTHRIMAVFYNVEKNSLLRVPVISIVFYDDENNIQQIKYLTHSKSGNIDNKELTHNLIGYEHEFDKEYNWEIEIHECINRKINLDYIGEK